MIDIEVPGQHVQTLACACQLIQQLPFSKLKYERSKIQKKFTETSTKPEGVLTAEQKKKMEAEQLLKEEEEKKL